MYFKTVFALSLPVMGAFAAPRPQSDSTATATGCSSSTTSAPATAPTSAYGIISARSASPVHLLPWTASGMRLYLAGNTASYCPESVNQTGSCPEGTATAFRGTCSMDVEVPGGQQIYVTPSGEIGYTQAHSVSIPPGANTCPFTYTRSGGSAFGYVGLAPELAFGATSFMGCPTDEGHYQVFAALQNATVPQGNVSDCIGFDALAEDYSGDSSNGGFAAWQYI